MTVLRRFDCILSPTKEKVLNEYKKIKSKPKTLIKSKIRSITKLSFYNTSKMDFKKLLDDPNRIAVHLNSYINSFSQNIREIMDKFSFAQQIERMNEKESPL